MSSYTPRHFYRTLCRVASYQFRKDPSYTHTNMFASSKDTLHCVWSSKEGDDPSLYTLHTYGNSTNVYHTFLEVVKTRLRRDSQHISPSLLKECIEVMCEWEVEAYYIKS